MFKSARLKLTAWYLLIIFLITGTYSLLAFQNFNQEIARGFRLYRRNFVDLDLPAPPPLRFQVSVDQDLINEVRARFALRLILTNLAILTLAGFASYFLAGLTLTPIEKMLDEQKRFVSDASHELRTPLTALKTETEVALRDPHLTLKQSRQLLASNLEETNKMQSLTNYLLALSRYQNNQSKLPLSQVDLKPLLMRALDQIRIQIKAKDITVHRKTKTIKVFGNAVSLTEMMIILLDNAVKYSHPQAKIFLRLRHQDNQAVIEIKDHGVGISQKDLPHIFDRFYRADTSRSKLKTDGFGLGLSIAKSIIELHHGHIAVDSEEGKGTTFQVFLPLLKA